MKRRIFSVLFTLVLVLSLGLVTAVPVLAQQGNEIQLTDSATNADQPDVAIDSAGNVHIAYSDMYLTSDWEIWYTMLDNNGNTLIDDTRLTADDGYDSKRPVIVIDSVDKVHIAWKDQKYDTGSVQEFTYTKLDPSLDDQSGDAADEPTITVVDDTQLTALGNWYNQAVRMVVDLNDDIHIVFGDEDASSIYYMKIADDGTELVAPTVIRSCSQWRAHPDIALDSNGNLHVTWNDDQDTSSYEIYYMMLDNVGVTMIDATLLTPDDELHSKWTSIVVDYEDKVHIVFQDNVVNWGGPTEIYYTKLDPSLDDQSGDAADEPTITVVDDTALTPDDGNKSRHPAVAIHDGRYIYITWEECDTDGDIHYMMLDTGGNIIVGDSALSTAGEATTYTQWTMPYLDVDANGKAHVVWCDYRTESYEVWYTTTNIVQNQTTSLYYPAIQAAIDAASPGDTILVPAGRPYVENLVVDVEGLTIEAASSPVIDGGGNLGPGVHITAANVAFQGFTIINFTCTPTSGIGAILVEGDGAIIDHNIIYDILPQGDPLLEPAGIGIDVHASDVEVTYNIVHDVGSIGIRVRHDWETAPTVSTNVLLEKNEVYRTANTGVLVTGYAKGVTVRQNEIYESLEPTPYNLFVHYGAEDVLIENNIIRDPLNVAYGHNVVLAGCDNVTISGNTITGATSGKNIYPSNDYLPWVDVNMLSTNVNIIHNDIQDGAWGIKILNEGAADPSQMAATITINFNNISGNTEYGVENAIATSVDATKNWWGNVAGPSTIGNIMHNPYELYAGNAVSDYVDYLPWLIRVDLVVENDGWNIVSFPIMGEGDGSEPIEGIAFYWFDSFTQQWDYDPYEAGPLDAMYVKVTAPISFIYPVSSDVSFPSQKAMKVGWNFVGLAELHEMAVNVAVSDALWGTGEANLFGYNKVISPSLNGASWTYLRTGLSPPNMLPCKGYWVLMVNDGVLGGWSSTPIVEVGGGG